MLCNKLTDDLEGKGRGLSWRERISGALQTRRTLGVSWWQFLAGGLRMRKEYEASFAELGSLAAGAVRVDRAFVQGDADFGAMPGGQVCGRIDDIPTAAEIIERTVVEAEAILESLGQKMYFQKG